MKRFTHYLAFCLLLLLPWLPELAFATGGDIAPLTNALNNLASFLDSNFVKVAGVLAVIAVGFSTMHLGKMNREQAIWTVVGIGIVVGAGQVMSLLGYGS